MSKLHDTHIELVEAVNGSPEGPVKDRAEAKLEGFRSGAKIILGCAYGHLLMEADLYYLNQGIDRPMCCGVWLTKEDGDPDGKEPG